MNNIENIIGYKFTNINLLVTAITHSSFANENHTESYERLEYLGDALANFIVGEYLFCNFTFSSGELSKLRAKLVSTESFSDIVKGMHIEKFIRVGKSMQSLSDSVLADVFESILAAIYLDGGRENAKAFLEQVLLKNVEHVENIAKTHIDYKTTLQEKLQAMTPQKNMNFELEKEEKTGNFKTFYVSLYIDCKKVVTCSGETLKKCEQECCKFALNSII